MLKPYWIICNSRLYNTISIFITKNNAINKYIKNLCTNLQYDIYKTSIGMKKILYFYKLVLMKNYIFSSKVIVKGKIITENKFGS